MRSGVRLEAWRLLASLRAEPVTEIVARRAGETAVSAVSGGRLTLFTG